MADGRGRQVSGHQRLAVRRQLPQKTDPDAGRLLRVVFEAVVPVGVLEPDLEHGVTGERQPVAAGRQADHAVPGGMAASALDDHPRRHLVLVLECPQLAVVLFQEPLARPPKCVREPRRHGDAGEIGRLPELGLGGRHVDPQVRTQPLFHPVGEQPATVAHVHVGEHHVGHGCRIATGNPFGLHLPGPLGDCLMIRLSIRRKIMGIAVALIVLMTITAILSMVWVIEVGHRLQELTDSYIPAYGNLARTNIRSLERALALRRLVIEKLESSSSGDTSAVIRNVIDAKSVEVEREARTARSLINGLIEKGETLGDETALARLDSRIDTAMTDTRRELNAEIERLLAALDSGDAKATTDSLERVDALRDDLNQKLDAVRADMLAMVKAGAAKTVQKQRQDMVIVAVLIALAAALGLVFAVLVSGGMTRPVRRLLEGTRAVEAGHLDQTLSVTSKGEIGPLTTAFNPLVQQVRHKERMRETFGK